MPCGSVAKYDFVCNFHCINSDPWKGKQTPRTRVILFRRKIHWNQQLSEAISSHTLSCRSTYEPAVRGKQFRDCPFPSVHPAELRWAWQEVPPQQSLTTLGCWSPPHPATVTAAVLSPSPKQLCPGSLQCFWLRVLYREQGQQVGEQTTCSKPFSNLWIGSYLKILLIGTNSAVLPPTTSITTPGQELWGHVCTDGELSLPFPVSFLVQIPTPFGT